MIDNKGKVIIIKVNKGGCYNIWAKLFFTGDKL